EDGIRDKLVTGVQTCALPISAWSAAGWRAVVDTSALPVGQDTLSAFLHTPAKGWWALQITLMVGGQTVGTTGELLAPAPAAKGRSEERRVGKEGKARRGGEEW